MIIGTFLKLEVGQIYNRPMLTGGTLALSKPIPFMVLEEVNEETWKEYCKENNYKYDYFYDGREPRFYRISVD